ncbi:hypothetical protein RR42_m1953 [Cupriavidus basilensis]|uniref:Uncharacterized protein n=1 Tax=Cupriavidus basilensis TaxID=68895 RepID=A0A0C4Y8R5_9BURK|nr:hypothetical protein RR42_m1953 [Cupriavidus basilensis]
MPSSGEAHHPRMPHRSAAAAASPKEAGGRAGGLNRAFN